MEHRQTTGHLLAMLTILIWGTTFISTKVLLQSFSPVEILFTRFLLGLAALFLACPRRLKGTTLRQEGTFALGGLCGVCLYYLLENIALTYTSASNVGVIASVAPFFTAVVAALFSRGQERLTLRFLLGFVVSILGIGLISFNGAQLELNPFGDLLTLVAALVWAFYGVFTKKIAGFGYSTVLTTRRVFCYGLAFMVPALFLFDARFEPARFADPVNLANLAYLGLGASALCFVTWNYAVKVLGPVRTSVYIYAMPVLTVLTSVLILHEPVTPLSVAGTLLALVGLVLSQREK